MSEIPELPCGVKSGLLGTTGWAAGQVWKTENGHTMRVDSVRTDGVALIVMVAPIRTRAHTQKPIPSGWVLQTTDA